MSLCQFLSNSSYYDSPSTPVFEQESPTPKKPVNIARTYWRHVFSTRCAKTPTPKQTTGVTVVLPSRGRVEDIAQTPLERKFRSALLEFTLSNSELQQRERSVDDTEDDASFTSDSEGLDLARADRAVVSSSGSFDELRELPVVPRRRGGGEAGASEEEEGAEEESCAGEERRASGRRRKMESEEESEEEQQRRRMSGRRNVESESESEEEQQGRRMSGRRKVASESGSEGTQEELLVSDLATSALKTRESLLDTRDSAVRESGFKARDPTANTRASSSAVRQRSTLSVSNSSDVYSKYDSLMQDIDDLLAQVAHDQDSS